MALICTVCGAENMEGSIYCEDCGARLPVASGSAAPTPAPISAPPVAVAAAPAPAPAPAPGPGPEPVAAEPTREAMPAVPAAGGDNVCGTCGASNAPGEAYCEDCGAALSGSAAASPIPQATIADTPPPISAPPAATPSTPMEAVAAVASGKPRLLATDSGQTFILSKDENLVGRRSPVDGIFPEVDLTEADKDSYISRRHGKIIMGEQGAIYEDLGSANGSYHNGSRLQQGVQARLSEGDNLRLGRTELTFHSN